MQRGRPHLGEAVHELAGANAVKEAHLLPHECREKAIAQRAHHTLRGPVEQPCAEAGGHAADRQDAQNLQEHACIKQDRASPVVAHHTGKWAP
jgi:hypothetical protein